MDKVKQLRPPTEDSLTTPQPVEPSIKSPCCFPCPKPIWCLLIVILVVAVVAIGGYYFLAVRNATPVVLNQQPPVTPMPTPTPDSTANWETYTNDEFKFSIKYSTELKINFADWMQVTPQKYESWSALISDRSSPNSPMEESVLVRIDRNPSILDKPITKIEDIIIDGDGDRTFYQHQNYPALRYEDKLSEYETTRGIVIYILKDNILFTISGSVSEEKLDRYGELKQILSTFRFTD